MKKFYMFVFLFVSYFYFSQGWPMVIQNNTNYEILFRVHLNDLSNPSVPTFVGYSGSIYLQPQASISIENVSEYDYPTGSGNYVVETWCYGNVTGTTCYGPLNPPIVNAGAVNHQGSIFWSYISIIPSENNGGIAQLELGMMNGQLVDQANDNGFSASWTDTGNGIIVRIN